MIDVKVKSLAQTFPFVDRKKVILNNVYIYFFKRETNLRLKSTRYKEKKRGSIISFDPWWRKEGEFSEKQGSQFIIPNAN